MTIITAIITSIITSIVTIYLQNKKLEAEFRTQFMAETALKSLLSNEKWKKRSFDEIKKRIGGFEDEELRKILVRSGAIRFYTSENDELWGLISRNLEDI